MRDKLIPIQLKYNKNEEIVNKKFLYNYNLQMHNYDRYFILYLIFYNSLYISN